MGGDGLSSELGPLAQALQRRRSAVGYQDQQFNAVNKFVAPSILQNNSCRKPFGDCNVGPKRERGQASTARRPQEPAISRPNAVNAKDRMLSEGPTQHRSCPGPKQHQRAAVTEQRPGVTGHEQHRREQHSSGTMTLEHRLKAAAVAETRVNAGGFEAHLGTAGPDGSRHNMTGFDLRLNAAASYDARPSAMGIDQRSNVNAYTPRQLAADGYVPRPSTATDLGQGPSAIAGFDAQPSAAAFEQRPSTAAGSDRRPGGSGCTAAAAFDPYHNGATNVDCRHGNAAMPAARPSEAVEYDQRSMINTIPAGPQPNPHADPSVPRPIKMQPQSQPPKPALHPEQQQYPNTAARPQLQQAHQTQQGLQPAAAALVRTSTSNLERTSMGPLTATAVGVPGPQRLSAPGPTNSGTLRASTGTLPPSSARATATGTHNTTTVTSVKSTTVAAAAMPAAAKGRNSADSISWMDICAQGRAEADRKRGFMLTSNDKSELKQWLYHDIMQRQGHPLHGHPLHGQKTIVFPPSQPGPPPPQPLVR